MPTRIGLMGLGRIGRNIFRILYESDDVRIEAISDIADPCRDSPTCSASTPSSAASRTR